MDSNDSVNPLWKKMISIVKIYLVTLFIKGQKVSKEGIEVQEQKMLLLRFSDLYLLIM